MGEAWKGWGFYSGDMPRFLPRRWSSLQTRKTAAISHLQGKQKLGLWCSIVIWWFYSLLSLFFHQLRLYKGCYQLVAGANPMAAQAMLSSTGRASLLRRRASKKVRPSTRMVCLIPHWDDFCRFVVKNLQFFFLIFFLQDSQFEDPALYSHEHAMAKLVAYKHLPPSMESDYTPPSTPSTPRTLATPTLEQRQTPV